MRILLVEDNPDVRRSVTGALAIRGHEVVSAENGLEAFALLNDGAYEVIVCDLALPFLQGNRFYEQLRESHPSLAARVIFVTGFATDKPTEAFLKATGQPYLAKPFETTALLDAVERVSRAPEGR